jgi:hypothetical protein
MRILVYIMHPKAFITFEVIHIVRRKAITG